MQTYTTWPTPGDVLRRLAAAGVTPQSPPADVIARIQGAIDAVTARVQRETLRQFLPAADTRYYSGSGTSEQEVDEMVSLTAVQVVGYQSAPGYTLSNSFLLYQQGRPQTLLLLARGSLSGYAGAAFPYPDYLVFPAGRANILVSGTFGFGATVPADLWGAVCGQAAALLTQEAVFSPNGRLSSVKAAEMGATYALSPQVQAWETEFTAALKNYRRPAGRKLRLTTPQMI